MVILGILWSLYVKNACSYVETFFFAARKRPTFHRIFRVVITVNA